MHYHAGLIAQEVIEAEKRIRSYILKTPLEHSPFLSKYGNCEVYLKLENQQLTRSFKLRGAINKVLSLTEEERSRGIVTASSGNHAAAVAHAQKLLDFKGTIFLPANASKTKIESLRLMGAEIELFGNDCIESEYMARERAIQKGLTFISPYNDIRIIGGQGTVALELEDQLGRFDSVLVPIGGGGLMSGIAGYLKSIDGNIELIGCQPSHSAVMFESVKAGKIIDMESLSTLSDGTSGGIEAGSITFEICKELVDDYVLAEEAEIKDAVIKLIEHHHILVEGAGALSTACFLKNAERYKGKTVILIISGAKIGLNTLNKVLNLL